MPFGVKSAPGIFQKIMDTMITGIDGLVAYLDDLLVVSRNVQEHTITLNKILSRIQKYGFKIKLSKCQFFLTSIKYLGSIGDKFGRTPDPDLIKPILEMPVPDCEKSLRSFSGMVNYYSTYVKELQTYREPLDRLLRKNTK